MAKQKLDGATVSNEKTTDEVLDNVDNAKKKGGFKQMLEEKKKEEERVVEPKANDQEALDLSNLNPSDLAKKLAELQENKQLRGWNPVTKEALIVKPEFIEKKKKAMEGQE